MYLLVSIIRVKAHLMLFNKSLCQSTDFSNESFNSVSCKSLNGFQDIFCHQIDFLDFMMLLLLPFPQIPPFIAQF